MSLSKWLLAASVLAVLPLASSCTTTECGDGTIEDNGFCRPSQASVAPAGCGEGTMLEDGRCVPIFPPTTCGDNTIEELDTSTGVTICTGTGGGGLGCESAPPFACPQASVGKVTVCGTLIDVATDAQIQQAGGTANKACDSANPTADSGPCSLKLEFYDALDFAGNPQGAVALIPDELTIDECGRYRAVNIPRPALGFLGVGIDDAGANTSYVLAGVSIGTNSGETRNNVPVYAVPATADASWTSSAGIGSPSFTVRGVYMAIFKSPSGPVAGVQVTRAGNVVASDDYYFADTNPKSRVMVDSALNVTGVNGSALMLNSALVNHSGQGPNANCEWPVDLGASLAGVVFVQPRNHQGSGACP